MATTVVRASPTQIIRPTPVQVLLARDGAPQPEPEPEAIVAAGGRRYLTDEQERMERLRVEDDEMILVLL